MLKYSTLEKSEETKKYKKPQITIGLYEIPVGDIAEQNLHRQSRGLLQVLHITVTSSVGVSNEILVYTQVCLYTYKIPRTVVHRRGTTT